MKRRIVWLTAVTAVAIGAALVLSGPGFAKGGGGGGKGGGAGGAAGGAAAKNDKKTVMDQIEGDSSLAKFAAALKDAGIDKELKGAGPFTVLAPNDAAIDKAGAKWTEAAKDKTKFKAALEAHILGSKMTQADIGKATKLAGNGNVNHEVKLGDDKLPMIDGAAKIVKADVQATNGYVQIIDTALLPADKPAGK